MDLSLHRPAPPLSRWIGRCRAAERASGVRALAWHPNGDALFAAPLDDTIRVLEAR